MSQRASSTAKGDGTVRFRIAYQKPERLLGELTRSIHRGTVVLETLKPVKVGTKFVFELITDAVTRPVEVDGEVISVHPGLHGRTRVRVSYSLSGRGGLDEVVHLVLDAQRKEQVRSTPRVPMNLRATEDHPYSPAYMVRDLSLGGVGLEVESTELPKAVMVGAPVLLQILLPKGDTLSLRGVVTWTLTPPQRQGLVNACFGVQCVDDLDLDSLRMMDDLVSLRVLPTRARISFGPDAFVNDR